MSTRATVHFKDSKTAKPTAIIYRHSDGYPEGLGKDLEAFIEELRKNVPDNRLNDPSYLAAKWVVWDVLQGQKHAAEFADRMKGHPTFGSAAKPQHPLDFLSIGIMDSDPSDIEHRYIVICDGSGKIIHQKV